jgi:hypothetical protein
MNKVAKKVISISLVLIFIFLFLSSYTKLYSLITILLPLAICYILYLFTPTKKSYKTRTRKILLGIIAFIIFVSYYLMPALLTVSILTPLFMIAFIILSIKYIIKPTKTKIIILIIITIINVVVAFAPFQESYRWSYFGEETMTCTCVGLERYTGPFIQIYDAGWKDCIGVPINCNTIKSEYRENRKSCSSTRFEFEKFKDVPQVCLDSFKNTSTIKFNIKSYSPIEISDVIITIIGENTTSAISLNNYLLNENISKFPLKLNESIIGNINFPSIGEFEQMTFTPTILNKNNKYFFCSDNDITIREDEMAPCDYEYYKELK